MTWSPTNIPKRNGSYARFLVKRQQTLPAATQGVVALPIVHDWGPLKTFVDCESLADFVSVFGQGGDPANLAYTAGYVAVYNAFKGAGADDPGAGRVTVYRMGNAAVRASVTISNTTPVPAIRIRAKYEGTRGNLLGWAVQTNAADPTNKHDFVVYDGTTEIERFTYAKADLSAATGLAYLINRLPANGGSGWVAADGPGGAAIVTGVALTPSARAALTSGADGIAGLVPQDWTDMRTAYEAKSFDVFVPYDLTDTSLQTAMAAWASLKNEPLGATRSKRFTYVDGGAAAEVIATALTRSADHANANVTTLGVGTYFDSALGINLSTSQLAPRLAGVIARRGYGSSIFCTHLDDLSIVVGASDSDILSAIDGGVVVMAQDSIGVRFENSVTTYVADTVDKPRWAYGKIKYVYTMQQFETQVRTSQESGRLAGRLNNNEDARETLIGDAQGILDDFVKKGGVQAGAKVVLSTNPPADDDNEFVGLDWLAGFDRSLDKILNSFYLS